MAKAAPADQLRLLELQAFDSALKHTSTEAARWRADAELAQLRAVADAAKAERDAAKAGEEQAQRAVQTAEAEVAQISAKIDRDEGRLAAGGLSKDLMALQAEVASLSARRSGVEDRELEAMEALEEAQGVLARAEGAFADAVTVYRARRGLVEAELQALREQAEQSQAQRIAFAATLPAELLSIYEKTLERRGVGAARLFHGTSEGSGMRLSAGDLADITKAAEDDIVFCPDSGCILVRSAEWS
ncbi:zinc ribbon domain-containing protein [Psychromicrobium xiongbiense]|uniref:zinc ribbon domain-containing protein n=1 Tax=Psychromicrobium xiongbiense TaxID=3051184 RepID=UPI002555A831|nr:C4-type zinc ribbon domain-containing protein [Psychromicrobium sp. YIM S02556]